MSAVPRPIVDAVLPSPTARLRFRTMDVGDLDEMAALLGDPAVMEFYPAPKTRAETGRWIDWSRTNYREHGFGLWLVETHDGEFLGDCGLTWQTVDGQAMLEIGYHVRRDRQGRGYATEAAAACRDLARDQALADRLVAIVHRDNAPSHRVAEKLGMRVLRGSRAAGDWPHVVLGMTL